MRFVNELRAIALAVALVAPHAPAQTPPESSTPEVFEAVDPYTKGKPEALDRAGYVSLGPFPLADGIPTSDVEETLGGLRVLWVETAHFKVGSLLHSYRRGTDDQEEKTLLAQLKRLGKKVPRIQPQARIVDPWARLHLYAQRLEDLYAEFQGFAGITDADFALPRPPGADPAFPMGPGVHLGSEMKLSVLLLEKRTQVERVAKRWIQAGDSSFYRRRLPGGSWLFMASAEVVRDMGTPLDSALHALVATGVSYTMSSAFRGALHVRPVWFEHGLALEQGRRVEPRWCMFVLRDSVDPDDETWLWEQRLAALVHNDFVASWDEMLGWAATDLEARHHITAWSRVDWLRETNAAGFTRLLRAFSDPAEEPGADPAAPGFPAQVQARRIQAVLGKTPAELDEAWRKWVRKNYTRK